MTGETIKLLRFTIWIIKVFNITGLEIKIRLPVIKKFRLLLKRRCNVY